MLEKMKAIEARLAEVERYPMDKVTLPVRVMVRLRSHGVY